MVAPALEKYTQDRVLGEVWKRPGLVPRERRVRLANVFSAMPVAKDVFGERPQ